MSKKTVAGGSSLALLIVIAILVWVFVPPLMSRLFLAPLPTCDEDQDK